jgi:hypothetical protein
MSISLAGLKKVKLSGQTKWVKYSTSKPNDVLVLGVFEGTTQVPKYKGKDGETVAQHNFKTEDGENIALPSAGQLNFLMKDIPVGALVEVVFLGKQEYKDRRSGKMETANQFEVSTFEEIEG